MPLDFKGRHAFLGSAGTPERIAPVTELDARFLVNRADADGVLLFAIAAAPQVTIVAFASLCVFHLVHFHASAFDASRSVAPSLLFQKLHGCEFVAARQRNIFYRLRLRQLPFAIFVCHINNIILGASCVKYKINQQAWMGL